MGVGTAPRAVLGAKVQIGLRPVQRCKRERHFQVPGLGPRVSGSGDQLQVLVRGKIQVLNLYPNLRTCAWYLTAETRDLKVYAPSQSSGLRFPLEACISLVNRASEPPGLSFIPVSPCHRARVPPARWCAGALTFALLHAAPPQLHLCTASPPCPLVTVPACPCAGSAGAYFPPSGSVPSAFTPLGIWPMSSSAVSVALKVTVPLPPRSVVMTMSPIAR